MGEVHVGDDKVISESEASKIQTTLNQHTAAWLKITNVGEKWKHARRYRETTINKTASIPPLSLLIKDHKPVKQGELPKTRPVIASQASMNIHMNNLLSEIIEPIANITGGAEKISTEDMLSEVDKVNNLLLEASKSANEKVKREISNLVLIGADATALFPGLMKENTSEIVAS